MGLFAIRKGERRDVWAAFLTLFALIASHSMLETARDALFLAKVPATRLPWVFLVIAALSFAVAKFQAMATAGLRPERALSAITLFAAAVTGGFFAFHAQLVAWGLYALYVWSGLLASLVLIHFWVLVGDLFTITQAKRVYGFIGAGSVLGAIFGSGAASLLSRVAPPERLLLCSAVGFGIAGVVPYLFAARPAAARSSSAIPRLRETLRFVRDDFYASRVAVSLFMATVCLTVADYVFKSAVAGLVPKAQLGAFLGTVYFGANVLSLLCQVFLVGWLLRRVPLGSALALLPAFFVLGGLGVAITGGLAAVLALKATDGALRYSLHRTASELLLLPFGEEARRRVKSFVDVVGQRGGQIVASLAILAFTAFSSQPRWVALALAVLASLWFSSAMALRKPYIDLFRKRLKAGRVNHIDEFPELDVASLETLLGALESEHDSEVIAALDVLERENKVHLVPALILYHPSDAVVLRALEILTLSGRRNFVTIIDRVIDHPSVVVRAATIAARSVLAPDADLLRRRFEREGSPEVRASIVVNLIASGEFSSEERADQLEAILRTGSVPTRVALAEAIGRRAATGFDDTLTALAAAPELAVRHAALAAMGHVQSPALFRLIVDALSSDATRREAERVLAGMGADAFDALFDSFRDKTAGAELRWSIPPTLARCNPERAVAALVEWLPHESDGKVRFQVIRTLERLVRRHPSFNLDRALLVASVAETLSRAYRYLDARLLLARGADAVADRRTPGNDLLRTLLRDKVENAKGRLFRLLGLLYPSDDFGQIYRGLGATRELRATSMELIDSILQDPLRTAVAGLADDGDDDARLLRAGRYHRPLNLSFEAVLAHLMQDESDAVREVTYFHAAELGLVERLSSRGKAA